MITHVYVVEHQFIYALSGIEGCIGASIDGLYRPPRATFAIRCASRLLLHDWRMLIATSIAVRLMGCFSFPVDLVVDCVAKLIGACHLRVLRRRNRTCRYHARQRWEGVHCIAPSLVVLDCLSVRDMPVFLICSVDQRADQRHGENAMLRARVQSTASRLWATETAV